MFSDIKTRWLGPFSLHITAQIVPPPVDVDFVDISDSAITDPAFEGYPPLLPLSEEHGTL